MAKKASTINIEENFWKEIEDYMSVHSINRNTAIEWMLLERRTLLNSMNKNVRREVSKNSNVDKQPAIKEEPDDFLNDAIDDVFADMEG